MFGYFKILLLITVGLVSQYTAKIVPVPQNEFRPEQDAVKLFKAIDGWGTDEDAIINILTRRSLAQRLKIKDAYKRKYNKDLVTDLEGDISGDFFKLMRSLLLPLPELYARLLSNVGKQSELVADLIIDSSYEELQEISETYSKLFPDSVPLVTHLLRLRQPVTHTMIRTTFERPRSVEKTISDEQILEDARSLLEGTAEEVEGIYLHRSYPQLKKIFEAYEHHEDIDMEDAFYYREFHEDLENGLNLISKYVKGNHSYFAERLYDSMHGAGTNDDMLIRIIVSRSEKDIDDINEAFESMYGQSVSAFINDDTSGDYRKSLLEIVETREHNS